MRRSVGKGTKDASTAQAFAPLDRIDRSILRVLQEDAAITNAALSERVHLSAAATLRRVEKLREAGAIRRTVAVLDPALIDMTTLVIVGVVLDRSTPESFAVFEAAVKKLKFVIDCHLVAGDFDYFLKLRVRDMAGFNRMHGTQLIALPGVRQTRTFFVMKEVVDNAPLDF